MDVQNAFKRFEKYCFIDFRSQIIGFVLTQKITVEVRTDLILKESLVSQNKYYYIYGVQNTYYT